MNRVKRLVIGIVAATLAATISTASVDTAISAAGHSHSTEQHLVVAYNGGSG